MVPVDRERTCPLLLRTFLNKGGHRRCASLSSRHSGAPHPLLAVPLPGKRSMRSGARSRLATRCRSTRGWTRRCGSSPTSSRRQARRRATGTASFRLRLFTQASTRKASWQSACTHARLASRANDGRSPPADKRGTMTLKEVGITHALRRGVDDEKTLAMLHRGPVGVTHLGSALARALCLLTARRPVDQGSSGRLITPQGETGRPGTQPPPRLLELAACKAVDATGSDHAGTFRRGTSWTARS